MPEFIIVAGPNGAGKSSFSKLLSAPGAMIFDADAIKAVKEKQYPDLPDESIGMMIDAAYWETEETTIEAKKDLTVETKLRDDFLITRALHFIRNGYNLTLMFMLLPAVILSMDRVNARVESGGHFVDIESIKYNFEQSIKMLRLHFNIFDSLFLFDSSQNSSVSIPNALLIIKNNIISFVDANAPAWAVPLIDEIVQATKI